MEISRVPFEKKLRNRTLAENGGENIAHVTPHVTAHAVTSCAHRAAHARRQAGRPNYTWRARNYLWTCRSRKPNYIYQK